jgi:hypothetical protein
MGKTPYEGWHGCKPDVTFLKTFGSHVCIKQSGSQRCKLDRHDFTGIFLGYTATDANIIYLDTTTGIVKLCHHTIFVRHGTYSLPALQQHNCCTTWGLKQKPNLP